MSKKKPYSKIENAKALRKEHFSYKAVLKKIKKLNLDIKDWEIRLLEETNTLTERSIKLKDWLWTKVTEDSPEYYSDSAMQLTGEYRQLLVREYKALCEYKKILDKRCGFIVLEKKTENADHRKQRGRTAPNAKGSKR